MGIEDDPGGPDADCLSFPFVGSRAAAQAAISIVSERAPCSLPGTVVHHRQGVIHGGQVARGWSSQIENVRQGGPGASVGGFGRRRRTAGRRESSAAAARSTLCPRGGPSDDDVDNEMSGGQLPVPRAPRDRKRRDPVLVEDYVEEALSACVRRTCGLPSSRPMTKVTSVVTARVVGDKKSRSRAIVLRQGSGKRDICILWVSSRDGFLCSCFAGHENALFFSASSRSTTCAHTVALRTALPSSGVSAAKFCSRMRLRADAADFAMCEDYGSAVVWSVLYHSVFSLVTFSSANAATCVAPCCRRFRGRCGHVRVARDRMGPDGFVNAKFGTAPAVVKARADARRPPPTAYDKVLSNEEEDEGLEKLASDTMRRPHDSAAADLSARTPRNLLPCAGELAQGEMWNRTADWRAVFKPQPAISAAGREERKRKVALILSSALIAGVIRDTREPLVEPFCGSCGQKRGEQHKVETEPGLLTTHHPTAPALQVRLRAALVCSFVWFPISGRGAACLSMWIRRHAHVQRLTTRLRFVLLVSCHFL